MRRSLVAASFLLACNSADETATVSDASTPSCATTSCVAGATCRTANGDTCRCVDAGEWTCGTSATRPEDAGFVFDTGSPDTIFTAPRADASRPTYYYPPTEGGCADAIAACDEPISIGTAQNKIRELMEKCGLYCTQLELRVGGDSCPLAVTLNTESVSGSLVCVANEIAAYRFPCSKDIFVTTTSCPD